MRNEAFRIIGLGINPEFNKKVMRAFEMDEMGIEYIQANDLKETMKLMKEKNIDTVVFDKKRVEIDWKIYCTVVKTIQPKTKLVVLCSITDSKLKPEMFQNGVDLVCYYEESVIASVEQIIILNQKSINSNMVKSEEIMTLSGKVARWEINPNRFTVGIDGKQYSLTRNEFLILNTLVRNRGEVIDRNALSDCLSKGNLNKQGNHRAVDVHIKNIRTKIGKDWIGTGRGTGYFIRSE